MKKRIFIHVGLHKTATTFFQTQIFPYLRNTACLTPIYTQNNPAFNKLQYADDSLYNSQDNSQDIRSEIEKIESENIIISDEHISGIPNFNYINRTLIAERLQIVFPDAEIIIFLRGQKDILLSLYNQAVKVGRTCLPINQYIWFPSEQRNSLGGRYFNNWNFNIHPDFFMYYELLQLYSKKFSKVHIFLYEEFKENPSNVVNRILQILNDDLEKRLDVNEYKLCNNKVNVKLKHSQLHTIRYQNLFRPLLRTNNKYLLKSFALLYKNLYLPFNTSEIDSSDEEYVEKLIEGYFRDNNNKVINNYPGISIANYPNHYQI